MVGGDKKKVLKALPDKLDGLLPPNSFQTVIKLWKVFNYIKVLLTCMIMISVFITIHVQYPTPKKINIKVIYFRNSKICMTL